MKIYTRTGDDGTTGLFGGTRVKKDDLRVQAYGAADELNAQLGAARTALAHGGLAAERLVLDTVLRRIQEQLFVLGADLASPRDAAKQASFLPRVDSAAVTQLERWIDEHEARLPALGNFILPGGSPAGSALHVARAVCRRAERATVSLAARAAVGEEPVRYLNRLGDLLFVLARTANRLEGTAETEWAPRREAPGA
jgi:cob(I)alamin adenosyltransferase